MYSGWFAGLALLVGVGLVLDGGCAVCLSARRMTSAARPPPGSRGLLGLVLCAPILQALSYTRAQLKITLPAPIHTFPGMNGFRTHSGQRLCTLTSKQKYNIRVKRHSITYFASGGNQSR